MRVALAQLNYIIGDFDHNRSKIIEKINYARLQNADLIIFSELCICGYPPRDFLEFEDFIEMSNQSVKLIAEECRGIAAIVGAPTTNPQIKGKNLFNSALLLHEGNILKTTNKSLLPNYDIFDEYRYFEPNRTFGLVEYKDTRIALTICEDIWNITPDPMYITTPMEELSALNPQLLVNIAASPFHWGQERERNDILKGNAKSYKLPVCYVNHVGAQTELLFDGNSKALDATGEIICHLSAFNEDFAIVDIDTSILPAVIKTQDSIKQQPLVQKDQLVHDALVMGIRDYFRKMGFSRAILGLSGGIDSAVTLVLAAEALGPENVKAVLMPSGFSSHHSVIDAETLALKLKVPYEIIPITDPYDSLESTLAPLFKGLPFNVTEENIQARIRAVILMAIANKFGYILLNTSNKSEAAVGYGTLYGDMCGGISVLGDVYKTEVYDLAFLINRTEEIIPASTISKPPSAELRPDQKDSDSLPDYKILDKILFNYIECRKSPADIISGGIDKETVLKVLKMVNMNEWKRHQTPPILRVSPKAFGSGRRMPIVAKYLS